MKRALYSIYTAEFYKVSAKLELVEFALINLAGFLMPLLLGHPQILVGTIVNALIFYSAIEFKNKKILPIIFLPSIAVLSRGLIFGPFTYFLALLMPFIWVGNSIQLFGLRYLLLKKKNMALAMLFSSIAKAAFLFSVSFILVGTIGLPRIFLLAMGPVQLLTAVLGGSLILIGCRKKDLVN
jgi:hypothetical protein